MELENEKIMIGLSGGINSMAVLCWLHEQNIKPKELHLFYAHFKEHSPDTFAFVKDGIRFAQDNFDNVIVRITRNSVIEYFEEQNIIPHPANSPCSKWLKIIPMQEYCFNNQIKVDLIGYIKKEMKRRAGRAGKQKAVFQRGMFDAEKAYPIGDFTEEWCFEIVDKYIGWHPAIYEIYKDGKRVFNHNNCLPCKNFTTDDISATKKYYPEYYGNAMGLSGRLKKYWGRNEAEFYAEFGRDLGQDSTCNDCKW